MCDLRYAIVRVSQNSMLSLVGGRVGAWVGIINLNSRNGIAIGVLVKVDLSIE